MLIGLEKEFLKRPIWTTHTSMLSMWDAGALISSLSFLLSPVSLTLPACPASLVFNIVYLSDLLPGTPVSWITLSFWLNLVTDFLVLVKLSPVSCLQSEVSSVSAHALLGIMRGTQQPPALKTTAYHEGEICQAPFIPFNTWVSWRFQNELITASDYSGVPGETGKVDVERTKKVRKGSLYNWESAPPRELTRKVCGLPFPFWQTLTAWLMPLGLLL